jgi:hypothetical protein
MLASISIKPVKFPPGRDKRDEARVDRFADADEHDRGCAILPLQCGGARSALRHDHIGSQRDQLFRAHLRLGATWREANVDADIVSFRQSQPFEPLPEAPEARLNFWIILGIANKHADAPQLFALLRTRDGRPCSRSAADKR